MGIELSFSKIYVLLYHCCICCYNTKVWFFFKILNVQEAVHKGILFYDVIHTGLPSLDVLFQLFKPLCLCVCWK